MDAAQSIQPFAHGSTLISTSPSTRSGWLSCRERAQAHSEGSFKTQKHTLVGVAAGKLLVKARQDKMKIKWGRQ